jgi:hypothetical protein
VSASGRQSRHALIAAAAPVLVPAAVLAETLAAVLAAAHAAVHAETLAVAPVCSAAGLAFSHVVPTPAAAPARIAVVADVKR